jgi:hypothetical protein
MSSKHLGSLQIAAINKVGDVLVPGAAGFPKFSSSGVVKQVDRLLDHMPPGDLGDLKVLLTILGFFPPFMIAAVMRLLEWAPRIPGPIGAVLRLVRLGLRGIIMSLYFQDARVHQALGYRVSVYTDDLKKS